MDEIFNIVLAGKRRKAKADRIGIYTNSKEDITIIEFFYIS